MSVLLESYDPPRFAAPALCAETDPEAFYPEKGGTPRPAKQLCGLCEAREECLAYALDHELTQSWDGVWGGTSPRERRRLLRDRERAAARLAVVQDDVDVVVDELPCQEIAAAAAPVEPAPEPPAAPAPTPIGRPGRAASATVSIAPGWADVDLGEAVTTCAAAGMSRPEIAAALGVNVTAVRKAAAHLASTAA